MIADVFQGVFKLFQSLKGNIRGDGCHCSFLCAVTSKNQISFFHKVWSHFRRRGAWVFEIAVCERSAIPRWAGSSVYSYGDSDEPLHSILFLELQQGAVARMIFMPYRIIWICVLKPLSNQYGREFPNCFCKPLKVHKLLKRNSWLLV